MAITVTKNDLAGILGKDVTDAQFTAVHAAALRLIGSEYRGDVATATGHAASVLEAVYTSIATRLITNPTGARSLGLGAANVTYGGSDDNFSNVVTLTTEERRMLRKLRTARPTFVHFRKTYETPVMPDAL